MNGVSLTRPAAVKRSLHLSFASLIFPLCPSSTPLHLRRSALSLDGSFSSSNRCSVSTRLAQPRVPSSLRCCPPNISSILTDHDEVFELPGYPRRAGSLINRPVTSHHSGLQASPHRLHRFVASVRDDRTLGKQFRPAT